MGRVGKLVVAAAATIAMSAPATAQFYFKSKDLRDQAILAPENGIGQPLPEATPAEWRAGLVWNLRAAMNVAALQCQFEPTLLTVDNYNAALLDHKDELKSSFDKLTGYFNRVAGSKVAGQKALDTFATRTYSSFATVAAQRNFCETMGTIGRDVLFAPRGGLGDLAVQRSRELHKSLQPSGEQQFPRYYTVNLPQQAPRLDPMCWDKRGEWVTKKCGQQLPVQVAGATPPSTAFVSN